MLFLLREYIHRAILVTFLEVFPGLRSGLGILINRARDFVVGVFLSKLYSACMKEGREFRG